MSIVHSFGQPFQVNVVGNSVGDNTILAAPADPKQSHRITSGWLYNETAADAVFTVKSGANTVVGPLTIPAKGFLPLRGDLDDWAVIFNANEALIINSSTASSIRGLLQVQTAQF